MSAAIHRRFWTSDEDAVLRSRYADTPTEELATELQRSARSIYQRVRLLGLSKSADYLRRRCRLQRGTNAGAAYRFPPGNIPANKGARRPGWAPGRMAETQFKPGTMAGAAAAKYRPIGTERISKDGYVERKINDHAQPPTRRWRAVHLLVWEAANGPLPHGHAIAFRNGNRLDTRLENLECVPRRELMRRNSVHRLPEELARTIQLIGVLQRQINQREHEKQNR